jgi:hypothetical protein
MTTNEKSSRVTEWRHKRKADGWRTFSLHVPSELYTQLKELARKFKYENADKYKVS